VRVDEAWDDRAPARVETDGPLMKIELAVGVRCGADVDNHALVRGDGGVADRPDVPLCGTAPGRRARACRYQARVLDDEVGGDPHESA
jgi:hypothetical protein